VRRMAIELVVDQLEPAFARSPSFEIGAALSSTGPLRRKARPAVVAFALLQPATGCANHFEAPSICRRLVAKGQYVPSQPLRIPGASGQ